MKISRRTVFKLAGAGGAALAMTAASGATASGREGRDVLALVEKGNRRLAFFDVDSGARLAEVELLDYPHELVADAARRFAYVGHYGAEFSGTPGPGGQAVFMVDLRRRCLVRTIDLAPYNRIHGVGMDRYDRLYALSEAKAALLVFPQPRTDTAPARVLPTGGTKTHLFTVTRDGERAYVTGLESNTVSLVRPHDPAAAPVVVSAGPLPESSCLSRDERTLFVGARKTPAIVAFDAHTMEVTGSLKVEGDPLRVYTVGDDQLLVTDLVNKALSLYSKRFQLIWTARFDGVPAGATFHPTKPLAYISVLDKARVDTIELGRGTVVNSFPTGAQPDSAVLIPR